MAMTEEDIDLIERREAYRGYLRIDSYRLRHRLFAGGWSRPLAREVLDRGRCVGVLLFDPSRDVAVLIEQFRIGALVANRPPWVVEVVAGVIENGQPADVVARREAREEANCEVLDLMPICDYVVSPGCSSETVALFCGRVDSGDAGGVHGLAHEGEDIRVSPLPTAKALAALAEGRIANSMSIIALQWLALNHEALRRRWLGANAQHT